MMDTFTMPYQKHELLQRIKLGDERAFARLFEEYFPTLVNYIYYILKDMEVSHDLAQDAFVRLWKYRKKLDPTFSPHTLLRTTAKRLALNELRSISIDKQARVYFWHKIQCVRSPVEEQFDFKEFMELAQHAVALLPKRQREVFRLSRQEGLSHEEIADLLNISKHTVNNLLVQALKTLKNALNESGVLVFLLLCCNW